MSENIQSNVQEQSDAEKLIDIEEKLCENLNTLTFPLTIKYVYNPLEYAKELHDTFNKKYFNISKKKILFIGLNPGPYGMCQNGIPFGDVSYVKNWFKIEGEVNKPINEHPHKIIKGLDIKRSEGSGQKFWGLFKDLCETPENFFKYSFVYNVCPLAFLGEDNNKKNITPAEIKDKVFRNFLNEIIEKALVEIIQIFKFEIVIGIGNYAKDIAKKALQAFGITNVQVCSIPHPSLRNIHCRKDWKEKTLNILKEENLLQYFKKDESHGEENDV